MKELVLGIVLSPLAPVLKGYACSVIETENQIDIHYFQKNNTDFIISYRYRHIVKKPVIRMLQKG